MSEADPAPPATYRLDDQVGFVLRRATQRHLAIFGRHIGALTPMQFAALAKLAETGPLSQNALGRLTAMDAATIKGVIDRLGRRDLVTTERDLRDRRRSIVALTQTGRQLYLSLVGKAQDITEETLAPLAGTEQKLLLEFLAKLA